ncbi:uncharacterized protein LOC109504717 [Harpegnathos saltator]|uniref:uncharacterized protein LOC109504717 n=1 Tax=Harpegnathos saltator TaxID=610380 RepID=UPI000DBEDCFA|nr:uncharacterized protein LOC109504717 [Harpegnathos saltator]
MATLYSKIPGVDKVMGLCYKPGELSQALVAFISIVGGANLSSSEVEHLLQRTLSPYMLPQIIVVDRIPLLTNGKTDRQTLLKQYEASCPNDCEPSRHCGHSSLVGERSIKRRPTIALTYPNGDRSMRGEMPRMLHDRRRITVKSNSKCMREPEDDRFLRFSN